MSWRRRLPRLGWPRKGSLAHFLDRDPDAAILETKPETSPPPPPQPPPPQQQPQPTSPPQQPQP